MESVTFLPEKLTVADLLNVVAVHNEAVREETKSESEMVLYVPLQKRWYTRPPFSWVFPFSKERAVGLDRLGREVWQACDGTMTMERIIEQFASRHHITFHEARISVMAFLRDLMRRGLVVLVKEPVEGRIRPIRQAHGPEPVEGQAPRPALPLVPRTRGPEGSLSKGGTS